jgi:DNA ligase (NAD+)
VSRAALDIEGLGESQLQTLADEGWVKHPGDLLRLPEHPDLSALARHHGWGMQSLRNMVGAIRTARETTLARGIYALAMRHIGQQTAELLAEYYVQPEGFWGAMLRVAAGDEEARTELLRLHGVGPAVLQSVERSFGDASWRQTAEDFWHGLRWKAGVAEAAIAWPLLLEGERVVFTGTLEGMTRDEAFAWVRRLGGEVLGQLSPRATLLVAGQGGGSKKVKAEQWSIPIWDGSTWAALIADAQTQATALHARGVE